MTNTASPLPQVEEFHGLPPSPAAARDLAVLRQAVGQALDRKRRLGQYAVVWQGGELRELPPDALPVWPAGAGAPSTHFGTAPAALVVAAWEPLAEGLDDPEDPPPQTRDPL